MDSADHMRAQAVSGGSGVAARKPSPPWYGGLLIGGLALMATILLTYTLLDWGWQQSLGAINYIVVAALIPIISVIMRTWQADESL